MASLKISDLFVKVENQQILNGINLEVPQGEVHAIMGPNGTGKSTLAYTLMGHPKYEIESGPDYAGRHRFNRHGNRRTFASGLVPGIPISGCDSGCNGS